MIKRKDLPALLTGVMATLAGIGIARFAYTPLVPALIEAQWFSASQAAYLGAANFLGYFLGALSAHFLTERHSKRGVIGASFIGIALSFLLCAGPFSFAWFFLWRLISGFAGGILTVAGPSLALSATPADRRTSVGALVFTGIGLGVLLSASVVPVLLEASLPATWITLGLLCCVVGILCDQGLTNLAAPPLPSAEEVRGQGGHPGMGMVAILVIGAYALAAVGFVPHTVFWVDYLAREHSLGQHAASLQWGIFGVGAAFGPLITGTTVRRVGLHHGLALAFVAEAAAVTLPVLSLAFLSQAASSFVVGAMIPGIVALTSGRLAELVGPTAYKKTWGRATAAFAAAQAIAGYGMSALYSLWGSYTALFAIGGFMLAGGLILVLISRGVQARLGHC